MQASIRHNLAEFSHKMNGNGTPVKTDYGRSFANSLKNDTHTRSKEFAQFNSSNEQWQWRLSTKG
jgi:hypothetical protein